MCGIAGIIAQDRVEQPLIKMLNALYHRGPDDKGFEILMDGEWFLGLGNTRLAILDLSSAGHMPMQDRVTGNWIVFNGEIYNYVEIRKHLENKGYQFQSQTDTEVILKGYSEWGFDVINHLEGMFAIAIWDTGRKELFLARDRLGEKPLYYYSREGLFIFASEVRAILASGLVERKIDPVAVQVFLHNGYCVSPRTIVQGVRSVFPGEWKIVSSKAKVINERLYWDIPAFKLNDQINYLECKDFLLENLRSAIKKRVRSDVPIGAFLSGGLDSSIIVGLLRQEVGDIRTFSIGFEEKDYDETPYARWVAKKLNTQHTEIILTIGKFVEWLDEGLDAADQPTFDGLNTYFVARAARESGLKVALSGLGGDELFGGYPYFQVVPILSRLQEVIQRTGKLSQTVASKLGNLTGWRKLLYIFLNQLDEQDRLLAAYQVSQSLFPIEYQNKYLNLRVVDGNWMGLPLEFYKFIKKSDRDEDELSLLSRYVLRIFQGERTLRDSDMMSMASSLELRTVFTDHLFIENIWKIPGRVRCQGAPNKPFEAMLSRNILGKDYPLRPKMGFVFPFQRWLSSSFLRNKVMEKLDNKDLLSIVGIQSVHDIVRNQKISWSRIWSIYVLLRWIEKNDIQR